MKLWKDYELIGNRIYKFHIKESRHLLWSRGGVPCLDKKIVDAYEPVIEEIVIKTDKGRTFHLPKEALKYRELIDFGYGEQYVIDKNYWDIHEKTVL